MRRGRLTRSAFRLAVFVLIAASIGCDTCLEAFRQVQLGQPLPEKLPGRPYRSGIGAGHFELGFWLVPASFWRRSLHVLTDENGLVIAKAYQSFTEGDIVPLLLTRERKKTVLEVQVPESWWREPAEQFKEDISDDPVSSWQEVRKKLKEASPARQRELAEQWAAWYEGRLGNPDSFLDSMKIGRRPRDDGKAAQRSGAPTIHEATAAQLEQRNVVRCIGLVTQLLHALPVQKHNPPKEGDQPDRFLAVFFLMEHNGLNLNGITKDGFDSRAEEKDLLRLRARNLGDRRIRIERFEQRYDLGLVSYWGLNLAAIFIAPFLG
ncbi:MAG: hypothetical protein ACYTF6_00795 [Planctomycetota bacterium]